MKARWITIAGYEVCVNEHDQVVRCMRMTHNEPNPAMPYHYDRKLGAWVNARGVKRNTLKAGIYRGTYSIM